MQPTTSVHMSHRGAALAKSAFEGGLPPPWRDLLRATYSDAAHGHRNADAAARVERSTRSLETVAAEDLADCESGFDPDLYLCASLAVLPHVCVISS